MLLNPRVIKSLKEAGRLLVKVVPIIIDTADRIRRRIKERRRDLSGSKAVEAEKGLEGHEDYAQKLDVYARALGQHAKVINRNSRALTEHIQIIEDLADQGQDVASVTDALARLVKVSLWISGISLVIAMAAVLVALLR